MTNPNPTTNSFHLFFARVNYPIILFGFLGFAAYCISQGYDESIWVPIVSVSHFFILVILEQLIPRNPSMNLFGDKQSINDIAFNIITAVCRPIFGSVLIIFIACLSEFRLGANLATLWPEETFSMAQIVLAILCVTFMDYWQHRMFHTVDRLWWFHALHHNPTQMHILKGGRIHFIDSFVGALVVPLPLLLLGAPTEIILMASTWMVLAGGMVHTNVDQRFPSWFHYVMPTIQMHNLHHSDVRQFQDSNYSGNLPLWDWIFGTHSHPDLCPLDKLGIQDDYVPNNLLKQLYMPFVWQVNPPVSAEEDAELKE